MVHGRYAMGGDGRRWLQYWLFHLRNDQDRGVLATGRHEGDWEVVQVRLRGDEGPPDRVTFGQHSWAESCAWGDIRSRGARPIVYVANGAHALYSRAGRWDRPWPDPTDEALGDGRVDETDLYELAPGGDGWLAWPGRWGASRASSFVPGEQSSPRGPAFQPDNRWDDPSAFDAAARPCGAGPPGRPLQWVVAGGVLLALIGAGLLARARRRPRQR